MKYIKMNPVWRTGLSLQGNEKMQLQLNKTIIYEIILSVWQYLSTLFVQVVFWDGESLLFCILLLMKEHMKKEVFKKRHQHEMEES